MLINIPASRLQGNESAAPASAQSRPGNRGRQIRNAGTTLTDGRQTELAMPREISRTRSAIHAGILWKTPAQRRLPLPDVTQRQTERKARKTVFSPRARNICVRIILSQWRTGYSSLPGRVRYTPASRDGKTHRTGRGRPTPVKTADE